MRNLQVFIVLGLVYLAVSQDHPSIVNSLERLQLSNGGFKLSDKDSTASIEATSNALFLASLYGAQNRINTADALRYLQSLENGDHGYGSAQGLASDLESTRYAIFAYQNLKASVPNAVNVAGYIQSLYQKEESQFANRANAKGDLKSTANAVQALKALNVQEGAYLKTITQPIHQLLKRLQKDTHFQDANLPVLTSNYYGIVLASALGYDLGNTDKWASFIASHQAPEGGFYSDSSRKTVSLEATAHALASLNLLKQVNSINVDSLISYVKKSPSDLRSSAQAHLAAAVAGYSIKPSISYEADARSGIVDNRIVQGVKVKPVVSVTSAVGVVHPNLTIDATITAPSGTQSTKLVWNADRLQYVAADAFDSAKQLGSVTFDYSIRADVAELSGLTITHSDTKSIGFGVTVASLANFAGKDIREGEIINVGTEIKLSYTLHNQTSPAFYGGDFDLIFDVLDSSSVSIYQQTLSGRDNKDAINFAYTLKSAAIPAGLITCRLQIKGKEGVHTTKNVFYNFGVMMIATEINFDGFNRNQAPQYKLGDTVKVSMVPASFPDLRSVSAYSTKGAESRSFVLDVVSAGGVVVHSIRGTPDAASKDVLKYNFNFAVEPLIENVGNKIISFRYVTASNSDIQLANYDSHMKDLFEDVNLNFTVNAELHVTNVQERPAKGDFFYGNEITFKFQIKDSLSNKFVVAGNNEAANVFLELKNQGKDKTYVSTTQPAVHYSESGKPQGFVIDWVINPNAVRGAGVLTVAAHDADGNSLPLYEEKEKKQVQLNVNIGGDIAVDHHVHNYAQETRVSTFEVDFSLKCQDKPLKDAQLRCSVSYRGDSGAFRDLFTLPVATNDAGLYETSWSLPHTKAPTGEYRLQFFREVDRLRAAEGKTQDEEIKPLFEISVHHTAVPTGQLPIRTEFFAVMLFGAAFAFISLKKSSYLK